MSSYLPSQPPKRLNTEARDVAWHSLKPADIPADSLDHVLTVVLKAMLRHTVTSHRAPSTSAGPHDSKTLRSLHARVTGTYDTVMAEFAAGLSHGTDDVPDLAVDLDASHSTLLGSTLSSSVSQHRNSQLERLVSSLRADKADLDAQLDDLRRAHTQVHAELNRAYREYDTVQRQLMDRPQNV